MSEYDNRQYRLMAQRIEEFEGGRISFKRLIDDLDALLECLQSAETAWRASFRKEWSILEEVYADAADKGLKELPAEHHRLVNGAVENFKRLLTEVVISESEP